MKQELLSADSLRRMTAEKEARKASEALRKMKAEQQEEQHRREMFMSGKITDDMVARLTSRLQRAADEAGPSSSSGSFPTPGAPMAGAPSTMPTRTGRRHCPESGRSSTSSSSGS